MNYEIIVVGGGHAGCEAALASCKRHKTLLITTSKKNKSYEKIVEQEPSLIFTDILDCTEVCDE